jgi:hypothetical protein
MPNVEYTVRMPPRRPSGRGVPEHLRNLERQTELGAGSKLPGFPSPFILVLPDRNAYKGVAEDMDSESAPLQREFAVGFKSASAWREHLAHLQWGKAAWLRYRTMPVDQVARENPKNVILPRSTIRAISVCVHEDEALIFDAILIEQAPKKEVWFKLHNGNGYLAGETLQRFYGSLVTVERGSNDE